MTGTDLFIADLHLSPETPDTVRAFSGFLQGPVRGAERLFILGDLFEYWAGDDDIDSPFNASMCAQLRAASDAGCQIFFMAGNRDFLIGERFAERTGVTRLDEPVAIRTAGRDAVLMHGDILCTDDHDYQAFRTMVRNPTWQATFLARPLAERKALIAQMRAHSEATKQSTAMAIMDVNAEAVAAVFRAHGCALLIHGHTHRPATHRVNIDGRVCERWVLADWHGDAPHLSSAGGRLARREAGGNPRD
jgi:UDP-2,3-diacylglucosamine hydrolase